MKKRTIRIALVVLATGLMCGVVSGQESVKEHYSAVWVVTGGTAGGKSVPVDIYINKCSTSGEIGEYAALLANSGPDKLRSALEKLDVGQFNPVGKVGMPVAVARKQTNGDKTQIRVLTVRNMTYVELRNAGRSVDYPYTLLTMILDKDGKGSGTAIGAAKITFNKKKDVYEIESFQHGEAYNKLVNIRRH